MLIYFIFSYWIYDYKNNIQIDDPGIIDHLTKIGKKEYNRGRIVQGQ